MKDHIQNNHKNKASEKNTEKAKLLENNQNKESNGISYEWKWMKYEKIAIILMVVAYWTYFFVDFAFFNLGKKKISPFVYIFRNKKQNFRNEVRIFWISKSFYFFIYILNNLGRI